MQPIVTFTTDFGFGPYLAQMKAVLLGYRRDLQLVDIAHDIPPQDIRYAALVLADATTRFPSETYHLVVVDPGVGTERKIVYIEAGFWRYLLPDNGLIGQVAAQWPIHRKIHLTQSRYWSATVAPTFHGRDIIAHVAGHLLQGVDPAALGEPVTDLVALPWGESSRDGMRLNGNVIFIDHFGNLITNITKPDFERFCQQHGVFPESAKVRIHGISMEPAWSPTYGTHAAGKLIALFDSQDRLEIAIVNGGAARILGLAEGTRIEVVVDTKSC